MLSFASKSGVLMRAISSPKDDEGVQMKGRPPDASQPMVSFKNAERLSNATLQIVLERIGDPDGYHSYVSHLFSCIVCLVTRKR